MSGNEYDKDLGDRPRKGSCPYGWFVLSLVYRTKLISLQCNMAVEIQYAAVIENQRQHISYKIKVLGIVIKTRANDVIGLIKKPTV